MEHILVTSNRNSRVEFWRILICRAILTEHTSGIKPLAADTGYWKTQPAQLRAAHCMVPPQRIQKPFPWQWPAALFSLADVAPAEHSTTQRHRAAICDAALCTRGNHWWALTPCTIMVLLLCLPGCCLGCTKCRCFFSALQQLKKVKRAHLILCCSYLLVIKLHYLISGCFISYTLSSISTATLIDQLSH